MLRAVCVALAACTRVSWRSLDGGLGLLLSVSFTGCWIECLVFLKVALSVHLALLFSSC